MKSDKLSDVLKDAHDALDEINADRNEASCRFCRGVGYDADGLIHVEDCIVVRLRHWLPKI